MTDFWPTFLGGVAAGIIVLFLTISVRSLVKKSSQDGTSFKLDTKQLGLIIAAVVGCVLVVTGALTRQGDIQTDPFSFILVIVGFLVMVAGVALTMIRE